MRRIERERVRVQMAACKNLHDLCALSFESIRNQWGRGYNFLGDDIKRALIAEKVLHVFAGHDRESTISPRNISDYLAAMYLYCGLNGDESDESDESSDTGG